jgi:heme exporter protein B
MTLTLTGVAHFYGARLIFQDVTLTLPAGGITLLAGANGAGKSTLLRVMAGLLPPSAGSVNVTDTPKKPRVGYLGHQTFLYPGLSARENLAFWADFHGIPLARAELREILQRLELEPFGEDPAGGFSRGMAQKLSLARLLLLRSDILLLDEPGTGLDARSLDILRRETRQAAREKAVVVWATHNLPADLPLADQVAVLDNKRLRLYPSVREYCDDHGLAPPPEPAPPEPAPPAPPSSRATSLPGEDRPALFAAALAMGRKDLRLILGRGTGLLQAMLLGLLLIFVFSLSLQPGERMTPQAAAAVFWMSSAFCQTILFSALYAHEEVNGQRQGLILAPTPVQAIWLGKALSGSCLLLAAQSVFLPAAVVFLGQEPGPSWPLGLGILFLADLGMAAMGSLLGALSQRSSARDSFLGVLLFPLQIPLFLAGISLGAAAFGAPLPPDPASWCGLSLAFDAVFLAAGLVLFPHIYTGEP